MTSCQIPRSIYFHSSPSRRMHVRKSKISKNLTTVKHLFLKLATQRQHQFFDRIFRSLLGFLHEFADITESRVTRVD